MIRVFLFSMTCGLLAALLFVYYVASMIGRQKEAERKKEAKRIAQEELKAKIEEARALKAEMEAKKAEAKEEAVARVRGRRMGFLEDDFDFPSDDYTREVYPEDEDDSGGEEESAAPPAEEKPDSAEVEAQTGDVPEE